MPDTVLIIGVACSDTRRNGPLSEQDSVRSKEGFKTYPVRVPGGALMYAGLFWIFSVRYLLPLFKAGARIVELENHRDCAGLAYQRNSPREKLMLWLRGIKTEDQHHEWLLARSAKRIMWFAALMGYKGVVVTYALVDPDQQYSADRDLLLPSGNF